MTIPDFDHRGLLPHGTYQATWRQIEQRLGYDNHRLKLITSAQNFCQQHLHKFDGQLYLGGSLTSNKAIPNDADLTLYAIIPVDNPLLMIEALEIHATKNEFKKQYNVDINMTLPNNTDFVDFFQFVGDKHADLTGLSPNERRGIVEVIPWKLG